MRSLLIEDDAKSGAYIASSLRAMGHVVDHLENGRDGLLQATVGAYDVLIVDRMLPDLDGLALVRTLRGARILTPVLFLTAMDGVNDRVEGLNAGADDYLVKPFSFAELSARINALARRPCLRDEVSVLTVGDLQMDLIRRVVTRAGQPIDLQRREFVLLEHLMRTAGRVQTRTMLLEAVWDIQFDPQTNVVDSHVSRLRGKIDKPYQTDMLRTVRGAGYVLLPGGSS
ncbi:winged helix-turn-helix domain-containing protein [Thalassobaculum sp.]|uniref:winged helix-turn-helix domain-containing protein n=1 Tax=Thalassobaculum sp. TaxID=2022740 RepID=UPI003B5A5739